MPWLEQHVLPSQPQRLRLYQFDARDARQAARILLDLNPPVLGVSLALTPRGDVLQLAFATTTTVALISVNASLPAGGLDDLLSGSVPLAGFEFAKLALHAYRSIGSHVEGVDLSTLFSKSTLEPYSAKKVVYERLFIQHVRPVEALWESDEDDNLALRAFVTAAISERLLADVTLAPRVKTSRLASDELDVLANIMLQADQLHLVKPTSVENTFSQVEDTADGLIIHNERYKDRVRRSEQTRVIIDTPTGQVEGIATNAHGKRTTLRNLRGNFSGVANSIRVVGREELTVAERSRDEYILLVLQGLRTLRSSPFINLFWFPEAADRNRLRGSRDTNLLYRRALLNDSQNLVVDAINDHDLPLVIVQGPPGTGKTKTISASVNEWQCRGGTAWIVAQSNVAVKNIAEKLLEDRVDFKLLVSKEFHFEWHEHIYEQIEHHIIRSDEFPPDPPSMERIVSGSRVILSTLSMLSNPILVGRGLFSIVPVQLLVVDEASQINVSEYMHLFAMFHRLKQLDKLCLFGDPKQLPPYGVEDAPSIKSVFELKHFKGLAFFLDTQYRMPVPLGRFISSAVYQNKLKSAHKTTSRLCVRFVDVTRGSEKKAGPSWKNMDEVQTVGDIVEKYYKHLDFCIITPYDAQRNEITKHLQARGLPWETVFNVDSFQGNEAKYVIVSVVRTSSAGFLKSMNRVNVMLTRCREGMVIVTNRDFITSEGRRTLVGRLAQWWEERIGAKWTWISWRDVINETADLPDVLGRNRIPHAIPKFDDDDDEITTVAASMSKLAVAGPPRAIPGSAAWVNSRATTGPQVKSPKVQAVRPPSSIALGASGFVRAVGRRDDVDFASSYQPTTLRSREPSEHPNWTPRTHALDRWRSPTPDTEQVATWRRISGQSNDEPSSPLSITTFSSLSSRTERATKATSGGWRQSVASDRVFSRIDYS